MEWKGSSSIKSLNLNTDVPNTVHFFKRCIMLPIHTFLKDREIMYICKKIKNFYDKN